VPFFFHAVMLIEIRSATSADVRNPFFLIVIENQYLSISNSALSNRNSTSSAWQGKATIDGRLQCKLTIFVVILMHWQILIPLSGQLRSQAPPPCDSIAHSRRKLLPPSMSCKSLGNSFLVLVIAHIQEKHSLSTQLKAKHSFPRQMRGYSKAQALGPKF